MPTGGRGRNLLLAGWLVGAAGVSFWVSPPASVWEPEALAYLVPTGLMVLLALVRRPPVSADRAWWVAAVCGWSLVYPFAYRPADGGDPRFGAAAVAARLGVLLLADVSLLTLGRSFGITPAVRAVRTGGPYRVVRHPVYSLYLVADACIVAALFSWWNVGVALSGGATYGVRAAREERVLRTDPGYRAYAERVRWRFLPGVY